MKNYLDALEKWVSALMRYEIALREHRRTGEPQALDVLSARARARRAALEAALELVGE